MTQQINLVEQTIQARKTSKVLLSVDLRQEQRALWRAEDEITLQGMLEAASWAPFHKRAHEQHCTGELDAPMPWRFHVVDPDACTQLLGFLENKASTLPDSKWGRAWQSRIKEMIAGCGVLIQVTWLPDPVELDSEESIARSPEFSDKNIEHAAAAACAVQNLLLAAESRQWFSYWSSGGILRDREMLDVMGISALELLLGAVFLTPRCHASARLIAGGLREQRGALQGWVNRIQVSG